MCTKYHKVGMLLSSLCYQNYVKQLRLNIVYCLVFLPYSLYSFTNLILLWNTYLAWGYSGSKKDIIPGLVKFRIQCREAGIKQFSQITYASWNSTILKEKFKETYLKWGQGWQWEISLDLKMNRWV